MKRCLGFLLILSAILLAACGAMAENGSVEGLSSRILAILAERGLENCAEDYICLSRVESPRGTILDHTFVLVSKDGIHHDVFHFTNDRTGENADEGWKYKAHYDSLAPRGNGSLLFQRHFANDLTADDISLYHDDQGFLIYRIDPDHDEYWSQGVNVHVLDYQFQVMEWFDRNKASMTEAYIRNGKIIFYNWDMEKKTGQVNLYTTFGLNTSFSLLPKSYKEAKEKFSDPPEIPGGTLTAEKIKFSSNKKYAVYSGPGENYLRGGNGKASVSTNDWIQVFGREDGWIMIQYDITSDHMRIGWIRETALPKKAAVSNLGFGYHKAHTAVQCAITDDPLFSGAAVTSISADSEVTWLASMGIWTYVEYDAGTQPVRGFIRTANLTRLTEEQVKSLAGTALLVTDTAAEGEAVTADPAKSGPVSCTYNPASGQWTVRFESGTGDGCTVIVEDQSGKAWVEQPSHG